MFNVAMGTEAIASQQVVSFVCNTACNTGPGSEKIDQLNCKKMDQSEFVIFPINSEIRVK